MHLRTLIVAVLIGLPSFAHAGDPPPASLPLSPADSSTLADKTDVLTGEWVTSGRRVAPAFGMDLLFGQQMGIRPSVAVYSTARTSFLVEGFYGALLTKFGASEGAGAGVRWVTTRGGRDAVTLGPGLDVFFNINRGAATFIAPTVDISWRHSFGDRAALDLGLNAGVGIGLSGSRNHDRDEKVAGRATPLISAFAGLRY